MIIGGPGPVEVIGIEGAEHRVTVTHIRNPGGSGWQPLARCACGWSTVDVRRSLTMLKVGAHMRANAPAA